MMSEAAHSVADTVTEVLLFVALKRGNKPADDRHPFGYGRETYFWAFMASLATFTLGAGFSVWQGISTIIGGEEQGDPLVSYIVLGIAFVLEGSSLIKAVRQVRGAARQWRVSSGPLPVGDHRHHGQGGDLRGQRRPGGARPRRRSGCSWSTLTGQAVWDGIAAILIGILLLAVAISLGRANVSLLIGQAASGRIEAELRQEIAGPAARRRRVVPAHVGHRPRRAAGRRQGGLRRRRHGRRHRADLGRGGAAAGRPAPGRALRLPRPDGSDGSAQVQAHRPDGPATERQSCRPSPGMVDGSSKLVGACR